MRVRLLAAVVGLAGASTALMGVVPAGAGPSGDQGTFCEGVVDVSLLFNKIEEEPTPKQQDKITGYLDTIEQNAPDEVAEPVGVAVAGVREGNFDDPAVGAAIVAVDQWVADNCGYQVVDVTGRDYEFEGIPRSLETGITLFKFTNEGAELHEIALARIKGDESVHELLELPEEEAEGKVQPLGSAFASPGQSDFAYVNLKKAGNYAAVCFIPVGSTDEAAAESAEGPPHAVEGMATDFTVKKG
ncbi:MAG: hypothetical protein ACRDY4_10110 [Acidimicrobiia bacterium]